MFLGYSMIELCENDRGKEVSAPSRSSTPRYQLGFVYNEEIVPIENVPSRVVAETRRAFVTKYGNSPGVPIIWVSLRTAYNF